MSMTIATSDGTLAIDRIVVAATATLILSPGENPRDVLLINNSSGVMDIGDGTVVPGSGIPIQGSGGSLDLMSRFQGAGGARGGWYAAYTGGSGDLCVVRLR